MKRSSKWIFIFLIIGVITVASCSARGSSNQPLIEIRVAVLQNLPPFSYIDEGTNEIAGFDIDMMDTLAERAGYKADYEILDDWHDIFESMASCDHDAYFSPVREFPEGDTHCWQLITSEGRVLDSWCSIDRPLVTFTNPYFQDGFVVTVRADNKDILSYRDLQGKNVGVEISWSHDSGLVQVLGQQPQGFEGSARAIHALLDGDLEAVIISLSEAIGYVMVNDGQIKIVGEPFYASSSYAIAVCSSKQKLLNSLNSALDEIMSDGTYDDLWNKWLETGND